MTDQSDYLCQKMVYMPKSMVKETVQFALDHHNNNFSEFVREAIKEKMERVKIREAIKDKGDRFDLSFSGGIGTQVLKGAKNDRIKNITATLRAKDREIAQLQKDPWCYDIEKAPKDKKIIVCSKYNQEMIMLKLSSLSDKDLYFFDAFMVIPEPKKLD